MDLHVSLGYPIFSSRLLHRTINAPGFQTTHWREQTALSCLRVCSSPIDSLPCSSTGYPLHSIVRCPRFSYPSMRMVSCARVHPTLFFVRRIFNLMRPSANACPRSRLGRMHRLHHPRTQCSTSTCRRNISVRVSRSRLTFTCKSKAAGTRSTSIRSIANNSRHF